MFQSRMLLAFALLGVAHPGYAANKSPVRWLIDDAPYHFDRAPFVHPRIIQDLNTWLSDGGDQVVAINLTDSQRSNRYFGDVTVTETAGEKPTVFFGGDKESFGYQYIGTSQSGVTILKTSEWGGGTGIFMSLMFVVLQYDQGIRVNADTHVIDLATPRVLIRKLGEFPIGDRYEGVIKLEGNQLRIGADQGISGQDFKRRGEKPDPDNLLRLDIAYP